MINKCILQDICLFCAFFNNLNVPYTTPSEENTSVHFNLLIYKQVAALFKTLSDIPFITYLPQPASRPPSLPTSRPFTLPALWPLC